MTSLIFDVSLSTLSFLFLLSFSLFSGLASKHRSDFQFNSVSIEGSNCKDANCRVVFEGREKISDKLKKNQSFTKFSNQSKIPKERKSETNISVQKVFLSLVGDKNKTKQNKVE